MTSPGADPSDWGGQDHAAAWRQDMVEAIPTLHRFALSLTRDRAEADELLSATVLRSIERLDRFEGRSSVRTWMRTTMYRLSVDESTAAEIAELMDSGLPATKQRLRRVIAGQSPLADSPTGDATRPPGDRS
jgi:hypothetical protein